MPHRCHTLLRLTHRRRSSHLRCHALRRHLRLTLRCHTLLRLTHRRRLTLRHHARLAHRCHARLRLTHRHTLRCHLSHIVHNADLAYANACGSLGWLSRIHVLESLTLAHKEAHLLKFAVCICL